MTYSAEINLFDDTTVSVSFEAFIIPFRAATYLEPAEGGIDGIEDAVITETDEGCVYGPSLVGLKLTDAMIEDHMDDFEQAIIETLEESMF